MVSGRDDNDHPLESFFNSLNAVFFSPLESGIRRAKDELLLFSPQLETNTTAVLRSLKNQKQLNKNKESKLSDGFHCKDDRKKGTPSYPSSFKSYFGNLFQSSSGWLEKNRHNHSYIQVDTKEENTTYCVNCLQFAAVTWSSELFEGLVHAFPSPFKTSTTTGKKYLAKTSSNSDSYIQIHSGFSPKQELVLIESQSTPLSSSSPSFTCSEPYKEGRGCENLSLELMFGVMFTQLIQNLHKLDQCIHKTFHKNVSKQNSYLSSTSPVYGQLGIIKGVFKQRHADVNYFLGNLNFARVGGAPPNLVGVTAVKEEGEEDVPPLMNKEESEATSARKVANGLLNIPLSNVERLRATLSAVSLTELIELVPHLGRPSNDYPDKKKLFSVQDFFRYTESEGRRFFEELDRDGDGQVTLEDLEIAMRRRRLPRRYAREFMRRTRGHLFSKSFGWKQFLTLMEQKEPTILRAYTTLCLSKSGTLQKSQILTSLKNAGLPANEDNAAAMMRFLNADTGGSISYGHFRNFMLLLPSDRLEDDPRSIWFEAATVVAVPPPVEIPAGSVLKSALAGGLASALSTSLLHPVDSIKTRLQASTLSFPQLVSKLPEIGVQGLYRGSIPAILGQFSSHGLRTGIFEASKLVLVHIAPTLPEIQVQTISSFCSTILGTAVRIPCEVLKQRLQAGIFDNVGEAIVGTLRQDGFKGFFRGTGATLCREVPFYVAGMGLYAESKKGVQKVLNRELEAWETIAVGALSGGLAAVVTTPFDVMKTRMMTAPQGVPVSMSMVAFSILRQEGPLGLFKGAIPRFFWIAPLGAMNFAGYELAKKAMLDKQEEPGPGPAGGDQQQQQIDDSGN